MELRIKVGCESLAGRSVHLEDDAVGKNGKRRVRPIPDLFTQRGALADPD